MYSLGIDIGYAAVKLAVIDNGGLAYSAYTLHQGQIADALRKQLRRIGSEPWSREIACGAITGSGSAFLADSGSIHPVNEVAALVEGSLFLCPTCASVIEIGGQNAKFVTGFSASDKTRVAVSMNPNCASGTGAFLVEQASRLGIPIEAYSELAAKATALPRIAGRCSVFAKTDIIHHQQEGVPVADILQGLAHAVVKNYRSAVMRDLPRRTPMFFTGGVARNSAISQALREVLRLEPGALLENQAAPAAIAVGAAILGAASALSLDLDALCRALDAKPVQTPQEEGDALEPLAGFGSGDSADKHHCSPLPKSAAPAPCWLGVDVGSTSTNLVLVDTENHIVAYRYLRTKGDPAAAVRSGLASLKEECGSRVTVAGAAATGSGRYMTGRLIGADIVRDEITAQARAAVMLDPQVDTIFEIGGQDSKFIAVDNGVVADFQMNKICAAGTGSFIEEQAKKLHIALDEFGPLVFESKAPVNLGERCTVFMETSIAAHLAHGAEIADLAAGLCYSIVKNYLNRVVGKKRVGNRILLQGGIAYNQGVVNAFRAATGKKITIPPFFSVTGAYGAALMAKEEMQNKSTEFKGFDLPLQAPKSRPRVRQQPQESVFNRQVQDFIFGAYDGRRDPKKPTVGIPRALFTYGMFPMFYPFFQGLGCNVLLSEPTSEATVELAQEYSLDETCYPVKLINGHAAELIAKGVDYLFFPDLHTVAHPGSLARQNYGCAYMQLAFKMINQAMKLDQKNTALLAPTIAFGLGPDFMRQVFLDLGRRLGKSPRETETAMRKSMAAVGAFEERIAQRGKQTLASLNPNQKTFVLISKIYGIADPLLNLGIPDKLREMGYQTIPFYDLPEIDIFTEHPNMYWPFAQHILEAAKLTARHPNLYAVFLSHHGCGPDSVTAHYFKEIMGEKPYLAIEVDEHASGVGVSTRVEAFVNSLAKLPVRQAAPLESYLNPQTSAPVNMAAGVPAPEESQVLLPRLHPYAQLFREVLIQKGLDARVLPESSKASIDLGREYTVTNEYFSLTALLGDVLTTVKALPKNGRRTAVFLPQTEGAEVDGQYARFLRTKLDTEGFNSVAVVCPFLEDVWRLRAHELESLLLALLAGDLVLLHPEPQRAQALERVLTQLRQGRLCLERLTELAAELHQVLRTRQGGKHLLALGEPPVLYNPQLNGHIFSTLEKQGHQVTYAPFSEYLWMFWHDYGTQHSTEQALRTLACADKLEKYMAALSPALEEYSPYAQSPAQLAARADTALGYYAGAFGRYRAAKALCCPSGINGIFSVASMYENTGISLRILLKRFEDLQTVPVLELTFDGTPNETDHTRAESFLFYI